MVFIKAAFQNTVRRFTVPDGIKFEDFTRKLVELFPELEGTAPESVALYYRDSDGDLVAVSSDEELHTAEQLVGEDKTLKLLVTVNSQEEREDEEEMIDLLDLLQLPFNSHHYHHQHHPFTSLFGHNLFDIPSWTDRRRVLQQQEQRLRRQREYEEKMRKAHLEHVKEMKERARKAEEERRKQVAEAKNKKGGGDVEVKEGSKPVLPIFPPGWSVSPFGSWEPVVYKSPSGSTTCVWGPWGYSASYGEDSSKTAKEEEQNSETKESEESKPQEAATTEGKVEA